MQHMELPSSSVEQVQVLALVAWVAEHKLEQVAAELPSALRLDSIVDKGPSPCRLWNHRDRSIGHIYCRRKLLADSGDRNIDLVLELLLVLLD